MHSQDQDGYGHDPGVGRLLSDVVPERVEWLWQGRIPKGKLTVVEGDPGTGKSTMIMDLVARVSAGQLMPDDSAGGEAAGVVILSAENGLADTVRPRLDAAGGDPARVLALPTKYDDNARDRLLSLPEDIPLIARGIDRVEAELVTIDPLVAYFGSKIDSHRDQDVRRVLADLADLAEWTGAAVVVIRHLNKTVGGNPLYRGGGSIGITAAARSVLLVAKDPEDEDRRVLAVQKSNLAKPVTSLAFSLEEADNGAGRVTWCEESPLGAGALLAGNYADGNRTQLEKAMVFLPNILQGGQVLVKQVLEEGNEAGFSKRTLERAKDKLGVVSIRQGDGWAWTLLDLDRQGHHRGDVGDVGDLGDVRHDDHHLSPEAMQDVPDLHDKNRNGQDRQGRQDRQSTRVGGLGGLGQPEGDREP
jgi:hypothetical protein